MNEFGSSSIPSSGCGSGTFQQSFQSRMALKFIAKGVDRQDSFTLTEIFPSVEWFHHNVKRKGRSPGKVVTNC